MAFKPQHPIKSLQGHRYTVEGDLIPHAYPLRDNWYGSFKMATDEESRAAYLEQWTTLAQRVSNASRDTCPRCYGRGATRKDQNIGCHVCLGRGSIPKGLKND